MNETYQAWIICEGVECSYVGDGWWQKKDGLYYYYCPECKITYHTTKPVDEPDELADS